MQFDQNLTTILSTLIGGVLAITGGFLASSFSQRVAEKAEKRKLTRERIEEVYLLTNQVKEWMKVQLLQACEIEEVVLHRNVPGWFFDAIHTDPGCPIERMKMITLLYVPSLEKPFAMYHQSVLAVQKLETDMRNSTYYKGTLEEHCHNALLLTSDVDIKERVSNGSNIVVEFVVQSLSIFEESQEKLHAALQQIAMKN